MRSGEYRQSKYALRDDKGFCCLGVACDLYSKETGKGEWKIETVISNRYSFRGEQSALPSDVSDWLGIPKEHRAVEYNTDARLFFSLLSDNDTGKSFAEIADIVESEPKGMFHE